MTKEQLRWVLLHDWWLQVLVVLHIFLESQMWGLCALNFLKASQSHVPQQNEDYVHHPLQFETTLPPRNPQNKAFHADSRSHSSPTLNCWLYIHSMIKRSNNAKSLINSYTPTTIPKDQPDSCWRCAINHHLYWNHCSLPQWKFLRDTILGSMPVSSLNPSGHLCAPAGRLPCLSPQASLLPAVAGPLRTCCKKQWSVKEVRHTQRTYN